MSAHDIAPGVPAALERFVLPEKLGFGAVNAPVMFSAEWRDGQWERGTLLPYGPIEVWPGSRALQYAELIFEGLKAYKVGQPRPNLFRAADNCRRMERSAKRLSMPLVPETLFFQGIEAVIRACAPFIPGRSGHSLYLRPFLYGTESGYMLRNSHSFRFMVIANPVESYATGAPSVAIERSEVRAARGGIGTAKAAANYAASLRASSAALERGHTVALWLDAAEHRYIQELSGMNFFAVIDGGLEKLRWEAVEVGAPGAGELRIRHTAVGVNFHDTYVRSGSYRTLTLPGIPGVEAAGVVERVGPGVSGFAPGNRVCYIDEKYGGYAEARILPARLALRIPDGLSDEAAAALSVKGLTACLLLRRVHAVSPGEKLLVHAAAGAVGQLLVRWAKHIGATVIATVGSAEKARTVRECGADEVILYREEDFVARVAGLTGGEGVDVVYDGVGADTFLGSLDCLNFLGTLVNFGQSSGPVAPFPVSRLAARSNALVRPLLFHYIRTRGELEAMAREAFAAIEAGVIRATIGLRLPLSRAGQAHTALESRATSGAIVLVP